jgi:hypothetical protein
MFHSGFPLIKYNYQPNLPTHFSLLPIKKKRRAKSILTSQLSKVYISTFNVKKITIRQLQSQPNPGKPEPRV